MKKIGLLCLALVVALGALGVGYAGWKDPVYINGSVSTTHLVLGFMQGSLRPVIDTRFPPPDQYEGNWDYETAIGIGPFRQLDKNVGWVTCGLDDEKGVIGAYRLYGTADVTLHNVYPGYSTEITVWIGNGGSIPLYIDGVTLDGTPLVVGGYLRLDYMEVIWGNSIGHQLEPGISTETSFKLRILQPGDYPDVPGAQQGATYTFTIQIHAAQCNDH